jgi:hypothetical protein
MADRFMSYGTREKAAFFRHMGEMAHDLHGDFPAFASDMGRLLRESGDEKAKVTLTRLVQALEEPDNG